MGKIKGWIKDQKDKVTEFVNSIKEDIKNGVPGAVYLPLAPFLGIMKIALKKSGYDQSGSLKEVAERFYYQYMRNLNYDYNHVQALRASNAGHHFDPMTAQLIATQMMPVIMSLISKFKEGTPEERKAVDESNRLAEEFEDNPSNNNDRGAFSQYLPLLLGLLVAGLLLSRRGGKS